MTSGAEFEKKFHDDWALSSNWESVDVVGSWSSLGSPESHWISKTLGDVSGLNILELGSGLGEGAVHLALKGGVVTATDLSPEMLKVTSSVAHQHNVKVQTVVASATDLQMFADCSFDVVYAANLLHHVDIQQCVSEIHRVLRPGGTMATWDPLRYNPIINIYRRKASSMRTPDEHPLTRADLKMIKNQFSRCEVRFFWLTALLIFIRFYVIDRISPNKVRYWKLVVERQSQHARFLRLSHCLDRALMLLLPPLKWCAWNVAVVAVKDPG